MKIEYWVGTKLMFSEDNVQIVPRMGETVSVPFESGAMVQYNVIHVHYNLSERVIIVILN